jgi:sigma-B regulation protein RsbU (phosphoserine phosphatase)
MPAGVLADTEYGLGTCRLEIGDSLFLFTDGVTEAENGARERFGTDRLFRLLSDSRDLSASGLIDRVVEEQQKHRGGEDQSDDVAILVCRRTS